MADTESKVASHYGTAGLTERIRAGLRELGVDPDNAAPADLKPVDEFHIGGVQATNDLLDQVEITGESRVLDIGCGLGGTARHIATHRGAHVFGVDLTPEFIETAKDLTAMVGVENARFEVGSALDLPVEDGAFDIATLLHVGMNIEDKPRLMAEARGAFDGADFATASQAARELSERYPTTPGASEALWILGQPIL